MPVSSKLRPPAAPSGWIAQGIDHAFANRRKVATAAAAALVMSVGYHVIFGQNGLTAYQQKRLDAQTLQQQLDDLDRENQRLQSHVERLQKDPDAIEHQAREELHYTRPGEVIYTLPPDPPEQQKR